MRDPARLLKQTVVDPVERLLDLIAAADPRVRRAFMQGILRARREGNLDDIAEMLQAGRVDEVVELLSAPAAIGTAEATTATFVLSGQDTARFLTDALNVIVSFDQTNERAVDVMRASRLRQIREFTDDQRRMARTVLTDGVRRGVNPIQMAREFRDSIGLTEVQAEAVNNFRRGLEERSRDVLTRTTRDRRFDRSIERAIELDQPLTTAQIDRMVDRFRDRSIALRARTIARTEALQAVHQASDEAYQQAVDDGRLDPDGLTRTWLTARDAKVRDEHNGMQGQQRPLGVPFQSDAGALLRFPGDPSAPGSEVINCRCVLTTRLEI